MEFDEKERREFDLRYNLLVNIQYAISLYQSFLLTMFQQEIHTHFTRITVIMSWFNTCPV